MKIICRQITIFFVVCLISSFFSTSVMAALPDDIQRAMEDKQREAEEKKQEMENALNEYKESVGEQGLESLKGYGLAAIDRRITSLNNLKKKIEDAKVLSSEDKEQLLAEIDSTIYELNVLRNQIEVCDSIEDLESLKVSIQNIFYNFRVYAVLIPKFAGLYATGVIESVIEDTVVEVLDELEEAINVLEDSGADVSKLRDLFTQLEGMIDSVYGNVQKAKTEFEAMEPAEDISQARAHFNQGKQYLIAAKGDLVEARDIILEMIEEIKSFAEAEITLEGTGYLIATGDGKAYIEGDGIIEISGTGALIITDNGGEAIITIEGFGNKVEIAENKWKYTGSGNAVINGSGIVVEMEGEDIELTANGTGIAILTGNGTCEVCGTNGDCREGLWSLEGTKVEFDSSSE